LDNGPSNSCPLKNVPSNSGPLEKGTGLLKNGSSGSGALGSPSGRALFKNGLSGSGPLNDGCSGSATSGNGLSPAPVVNCLTPVGNGSSGSRPLCRGLLGGNGLSGTRVSVSAAVKSRRGVPPGVVCSRLVIGYKLGSGKAVD
jgi:hypothetical protein